MYKNISAGIKKVQLDSGLFKLHKSGTVHSDFGMDNTPGLLDNGFGLYSTVDLKKSIGPIKTQYYRISLTRKGSADFSIGLEKYTVKRNSILFGIPGQVFSLNHFSKRVMLFDLQPMFTISLMRKSTLNHMPEVVKKLLCD